MAPLRRYLRITKHSVLEVRIYLDRPADADTWLLKRDNPALPRVIQAIRPLVLPKLREENERVKGRGSARAKKKGVKDVVVEDDFEVSIFLTELSSRHSVLTKQKIVKNKARIQSNSGKLTGWLTAGTSEQPVIINEDAVDPIVIREEEDDDAINLTEIPEKENKTQRATRAQRSRDPPGHITSGSSSDSGASDLFVPEPNTKQSKTMHHPMNIDQDGDNEEPQDNDNKKLRLNTSYDGFSIYGRILCLVVKRKGARNPVGSGATASQAMLENWVSTQAAAEQVDDDEEGG